MPNVRDQVQDAAELIICEGGRAWQRHSGTSHVSGINIAAQT